MASSSTSIQQQHAEDGGAVFQPTSLLRDEPDDEIVPDSLEASPRPVVSQRASSEVVPSSVTDADEYPVPPPSLKRKRTIEDLIDTNAENALTRSPPSKVPKDGPSTAREGGPSFIEAIVVEDSNDVKPPVAEASKLAASPPSHGGEPLSTYMCPICFCPPTNATLTPCGHICCGQCLFTAVRTTLQRAITHVGDERPEPRCPVCRAVLKGWDGRGGGVIGLQTRAVFSL